MTEIKNTCRCCLKENVQMKSVNTLWNETILNEMFYFLIGVETQNIINIFEKSNICENCESNLILSYSFKQQCIKSEETLNDILLTDKKYVNVKKDDFKHLTQNQQQISTEYQEKDLDLNELQEIIINKGDNILDEDVNEVNLKVATIKESIKKKKHRLNLDSNFRHCLRCKLQFPDLQSYQVHHRQIHRAPILCPLCGKMVSRQALEKHISTHTNQKNHLCTECGKCFTLSENLKKHWRIHTNDKRYTCEFCGEKFIHWNSKRSHIRTTHTLEKKYECTICKKRFAQSSNMFRHLRSHTGELPHACSYCNKKFVTSPELKNHIVTHTKERNHICEYENCKKAFGTKKSLRTHTKIHTGEKNYICPVCSKAFTQAHVLRTHMKTHHEEYPQPAKGCVLSQRNKNVNILPHKSIANTSEAQQSTIELI